MISTHAIGLMLSEMLISMVTNAIDTQVGPKINGLDRLICYLFLIRLKNANSSLLIVEDAPCNEENWGPIMAHDDQNGLFV